MEKIGTFCFLPQEIIQRDHREMRETSLTGITDRGREGERESHHKEQSSRGISITSSVGPAS